MKKILRYIWIGMQKCSYNLLLKQGCLLEGHNYIFSITEYAISFSSQFGSGTKVFLSYKPAYIPLFTWSSSKTLKVFPKPLKANSAMPGISLADNGSLFSWLIPNTKL